jgi:hypothetical protein
MSVRFFDIELTEAESFYIRISWAFFNAWFLRRRYRGGAKLPDKSMNGDCFLE